MGTMPVYRQGRTYNVPPPGERRSGNECAACVMVTFLLVGVPIFLVGSERGYHNDIEAFHEVEDDVVKLADVSSSAPHQIVHLQATSFSSVNEDTAFGVSVDGTLSLKRVTQYCQWREGSTESCEQCPNNDGNGTHPCHCTQTYNYIKDWQSHLINSLVFDQPAAHWNPQRDPYPSAQFFASQVSAIDIGGGEAILGASLLNDHSIQATSRRVDWTLGALPTPSFWTWLFGDTTRYEQIRSLQNTVRSQAYSTDKFVYVGQGGYFFSRYEGSGMGQLFNWFGQYLEGSLTDFQVGDIVGWLGLGCQAGDIRVRYSVQDPAEISVIAGVAQRSARAGIRRIDRDGKAYTFEEVSAWYKGTYTPMQVQTYWEGMRQSNAAELGIFRTPRGHNVGMVHEGLRSPKQMFDAALARDWWWCFGWRLAMALWAWVVGSYLMCPPWVGGMLAPLTQGDLRVAAGIYLIVLALVWVWVWGIEEELQIHDLYTPTFLVLGLGMVSSSFAGSSPAKTDDEHAKTK